MGIRMSPAHSEHSVSMMHKGKFEVISMSFSLTLIVSFLKAASMSDVVSTCLLLCLIIFFDSYKISKSLVSKSFISNSDTSLSRLTFPPAEAEGSSPTTLSTKESSSSLRSFNIDIGSWFAKFDSYGLCGALPI